jgi:demethylmenaquinone methyltransferase/2-methoxy-6-polyprenyl-1,4-benzoquinol methylase
MSLRERIATPDGKRRFVRAIFSTIADRYDFITVVLSYGQDRRRKRRLIALAAPRADARALDLATGTGDIAFALAARGAGVIGLDITFRMIELARNKRGAGRTPSFLVGDMLALPFPSGSFDVVTTGYGLRNVPTLAAAIDEIERVLARGQLLARFQSPGESRRAVGLLAYLTVVGATLSWVLRDADTYRCIRIDPATPCRPSQMFRRAASPGKHYPSAGS